ncbi:MAG TPA: protoporphyrinogen oxidase HemJ [Gemmatimonadales bacterium]|nr:protoporphyrinogen oxidase HemJ [Gemmatimonadales bacterium]
MSASWYLWLKAFHLIGVVSWFAALFYIVRLFVYHAEALDAEEPRRGILTAQYAIMERRLYNMIQQPAMWITVVTAALMLVIQPSFLREAWMIVKLVLVGLLVWLHYASGRMIKGFLAGTVHRSGEWFRWANEGPTFLLVGCTILAVFKSQIPWGGLGWAMVGLLVVIVGGIKWYARYRVSHPEATERPAQVRR